MSISRPETTSGLSDDAEASCGYKIAGRRLAKSFSSARNASSAFSGRRSRGSVSYLGPPTAPSRTADHGRLQLDLQAKVASQVLQHLNRFGDNLGADAVSRQYCNFLRHMGSIPDL